MRKFIFYFLRKQRGKILKKFLNNDIKINQDTGCRGIKQISTHRTISTKAVEILSSSILDIENFYLLASD